MRKTTANRRLAAILKQNNGVQNTQTQRKHFFPISKG